MRNGAWLAKDGGPPVAVVLIDGQWVEVDATSAPPPADTGPIEVEPDDEGD